MKKEKATKSKKETTPIIKKAVETLKGYSINMPTDREIFEELVVEVAKQYKRNAIVNAYLLREYSTNKKDMDVTRSIAHVQNEMKTQEAYLEYLLEKLNEDRKS